MAATSSPARQGRLPVLAKYQVLEELGHGGMATVYRAHDARLGRDVAVKVLHPHLKDSFEVAHRFSAEAKAVAKLRHANIVEVYDVSGEDDGEQYLVVELLRGVTLRRILQRQKKVPPEVAAAIALDLLSALSHAHQCGVIHRDVKPENVMVEHRPISETGEASTSVPSDRRGERVMVKLTDFGIAKLLDAQGVTSTGQVLGSPAHMAPEQIEGGDVDVRADVFGMGVLLYECMVGHLPFEGANPAQVLRRVLDGIYPPADREEPMVGKRWSEILDRALARSVNERFANPEKMAEAIRTELVRLGFDSPRSLVEEWLDDPEAFEETSKKVMIDTLCALGKKARSEGDALSAAADYNRALAYAPHDMALIKIVSGLSRAEARYRFVKRALPALLLIVTSGSGAFFIARQVRQRETKTPPIAQVETPAPSTRILPPIAPAPVPSVKATQVSAPIAAPQRPAATSKRTVVFASIKPSNGVRFAVDGEALGSAVSGNTLTLDDKAHELVFSCVEDLCEPRRVLLNAGEKEETISVDLKIRDAVLVIDGAQTNTYHLAQDPSRSLRAGVPLRIPMLRGNERVNVVERETGHTRSITLKPGQEAHAGFLADP